MEVAKLESSDISFITKAQRRSSYSFWKEQKVFLASNSFVRATGHGTEMRCTRQDVIPNGLW
jgi:hypothetical protein